MLAIEYSQRKNTTVNKQQQNLTQNVKWKNEMKAQPKI